MRPIDAAKPSLRGYLRTRRLVAHPVFLIMQVIHTQLLIGLWINYKGVAFKKFHIDFVFFTQVLFEAQADIGAGILMLFCMLATRRINDIFLQWNKKHILLCLLSGFVGVFMAQLCFCLGLRSSEAKYTAPWMLLNPIFTTILGLLLGYEKIRRLKTIGLTASILGTVGLIILKNFGTEYPPTIFLFLNSCCNATGVIIWRKLLVEYKLPPLIVASWNFISASVSMILAYITEPLWYPEQKFHDFYENIDGFQEIMPCCFVIILGYAATYMILIWATHKSSISIVALYASARPLFTVILSFIIKPDTLRNTMISIALLGIVLFGLVASSISKKSEKIQKLNIIRKNVKERLTKAFNHFPAGEKLSRRRPPSTALIS